MLLSTDSHSCQKEEVEQQLALRHHEALRGGGRVALNPCPLSYYSFSDVM
jgi:hypothetical protein